MAAGGNTIEVYTTQGGTNVTSECTFMTAAGNAVDGFYRGAYFMWPAGDSIGKIRYNNVVYLCQYGGVFEAFTCYLDQLTPEVEPEPEPEPVTTVSPAIYFGEILMGTAIDPEPQTPSITNYLKLGSGVTGKYGDSVTGTVIEVGSGYDISDLTNNPPVIYDNNGDQLTCTYFGISGSNLCFSAVIGGISRTVQVTTYANPQTYTYALSGGASN